MTLITRQQKGSKLTIEEMDGNLTYLEELAQSGATINEITYSNFVTLIQNEELVPLQYYKITDYQTVHYILDGNTATSDINTGVTEHLILKAVSNDQIDKVAISLDYTQDLIYYDWDPNNWLDDVSFGDGNNIVSGFKGVIYYRKDTLQNNTLSYDFRNVKMRRWFITSVPGSPNTSYIGTRSDEDGVSDVNNYRDYYTFSSEDGNQSYDESIKNNFIEQSKLMKRNIINLVYIKRGLADDIFISNIMKECYNTTFVGVVHSNDVYFGANFYISPLTIEDRIIRLPVVSFKHNNIKCNFVGYNSFGVWVANSNNIKSNYYSNCNFNGFEFNNNNITCDWIDDFTSSNTFANNNISCDYINDFTASNRFTFNNIIVDYFNFNVFSDIFSYNEMVSSYIDENIFSRRMEQNRFVGAYFYKNIFDFRMTDNFFEGDFFDSNEFIGGGNFFSNRFYINYMNNNIFEANSITICIRENIFYASLSDNTITITTNSQHFEKNVFHSDFTNNNITVGRSFTSNIIGNNFRNNTITISGVGNEFKSNVIGNLFENNTITNRFAENVIGNFCHNNIFGTDFFSNQIGNAFNNNDIGDWFVNNVVDSNVAYIITSGGTNQNDAFRNNHITGLVQGTSGSPIELDQPEYYENHLTTTYRRPDNVIRMKYDDNNDETVIKSPTL